jgi:hypothetical protein
VNFIEGHRQKNKKVDQGRIRERRWDKERERMRKTYSEGERESGKTSKPI